MTETRPRSALAVALNPTIDLSSEVDRVQPTRKMRTRNERRQAGGGGVNVARVIAELGGRPELLVLTGGATGAMLEDWLRMLPIDLHVVPIAEPTRIAFMVQEKESGFEYRFVPEGPEVSKESLADALKVVVGFKGDFVIASGSLPRGAPGDTYARMAEAAAENGAKVLLDCPGSTLRETLGKAPILLVKPSIGELETLVGRRLNEQGVGEAAATLVKDGAAEYVAVTMGREGAWLAGPNGILRVPSKHVVVQSAVGAGDSFVGALSWFLMQGKSMEDAFRFGVAAGAAAAMTPGTELCRRDDVFAIYGAEAGGA
ncbi:Tagatose-6-phosphate kinase (plasmid) [Sinorhizobium sojae CCBAU 05684]|uniref:Phosphofructokinase n=1 Tax=Sinorhizobium sojae CCBAU 05684 TaxID=716928 RepID=A0A249PIN7_9HYPH|nr:1-phosphofructokinase family hexose kinase [Sinorhizobium sojae]ASY65800.1 Tagatose-6-phosphate kinase [Sinorhizobium sojae CCBAU 05684]